MDLKLDNEDWFEASEAPCATPESSVYVTYSGSFEPRNPAAAKFLNGKKLDPAVANEWISIIGRDELDPQDVTEEWVAATMDTAKEWIKWSMLSSTEKESFVLSFLLAQIGI